MKKVSFEKMMDKVPEFREQKHEFFILWKSKDGFMRHECAMNIFELIGWMDTVWKRLRTGVAIQTSPFAILDRWYCSMAIWFLNMRIWWLKKCQK